MNQKIVLAVKKSGKAFYTSLPVMLGIILLLGMSQALIPSNLYQKIFSQHTILDTLIGGVAGSVFAGNPITSYIIGGELLNQGVSIAAVTAFLVSWVTVGLVQLPAESILLGRKFAITRNLMNFFFAVIIGLIMIFIEGLL